MWSDYTVTVVVGTITSGLGNKLQHFRLLSYNFTSGIYRSMWQSTESIDQADEYGRKLLAAALPKMTDIEKFNLLRSISITTAGMRAHSEGTMSKEQVESAVLHHYHTVLSLDLARHQGGLSGKLTVENLKQRSLHTNK